MDHLRHDVRHDHDVCMYIRILTQKLYMQISIEPDSIDYQVCSWLQRLEQVLRNEQRWKWDGFILNYVLYSKIQYRHYMQYELHWVWHR